MQPHQWCVCSTVQDQVRFLPLPWANLCCPDGPILTCASYFADISGLRSLDQVMLVALLPLMLLLPSLNPPLPVPFLSPFLTIIIVFTPCLQLMSPPLRCKGSFASRWHMDTDTCCWWQWPGCCIVSHSLQQLFIMLHHQSVRFSGAETLLGLG